VSDLPADPAAHLGATLRWLHPGGDEVFELRLINPAAAASPHWQGRVYGGAGGKAIVAGWFRDQARAVAAVREIKAEGIYITLNPCQEALLARVHERLQAGAKPTTADKDIAARRNLLVDFDPVRPTGISSTDNEHEVAILFAQQVAAELAADGWPAPLVGDSGNGAHLIYAIELDNTPEAMELVKAVLGGLAQRFAEKLAACGLELDRTVFNAARISKLYGTRTGKGDNLPERPHRYAKIVALPAERVAVSLKLLQDLAALFTPQASGGSGGSKRHSKEEKQEGRFDLAAYLDHYGVEVVSVKPHGSSTLHVLAQCVFDPAHSRKEAAIGQTAEGKIFYQCFHNSCKGQTWAEARQLISHSDKLGQFVVGGTPAAGKRGGKLRVVDGGKAPPGVPTAPPGTPPAAPVTEGFSRSDLGNARRMVALYGQDLRFSHLNKEWYCWTGKHWAVDNCGEVVRRAKAAVESLYDEAQGHEWGSETRKKLVNFALKSESAGRITGMLNLAQSEPGIPVLPEEFDADPWLFNAANGTIDLRTGALQEHRREDLLTCLSPVAYDPEATCDTFERFLFEIMGYAHDQESAKQADDLSYFLKLSFGYALTGDCREECFWMFWGAGANGKGTLMHCMSYIFGTYWLNVSTETLLAKDSPGQQIRSDVARLAGPRMITAAEIDKGRRLSESLVKALTGQDSVTARFLYGKEFDFVPRFKLFIETNNKPIIKDQTNATWRRLKLVEFPMDFRKDPDRELGAKLRAESPGILSWLVRGCLAWQKGGTLCEPDSVKQAVQYYRDQMNPLKDFLNARCILAADLITSAADLYGAYCDWAEGNLQKKERLTKRAFGLTLGEQGFKNRGDDGRELKGTAGVRLWRGLGLRTIE
jgi:putative DNA primase/helicase